MKMKHLRVEFELLNLGCEITDLYDLFKKEDDWYVLIEAVNNLFYFNSELIGKIEASI